MAFAIPSLAIIPVITIPIALAGGVNPIMTTIIGELGRMSPLTPESAVVRTLMEEQNVISTTVPIMDCMAVNTNIYCYNCLCLLKGWKIEQTENEVIEKSSKINKHNS